MAGSLNAGFTNNINVIQIRTSGSSMQRVTDRSIDIDSDGDVETVTFNPGTLQAGSTNKFSEPPTVTTPAGVARTVVETTVEPDGGVDVTGTFYTEGA